MKRLSNVDTHAAWIAGVLWVLSVAGFGAALEGYSQRTHPVALLGARGVPLAPAFDLAGFILPGLLAAVVAVRLRARLPAETGWSARIGAGLVLLSALGFALQGVFRLDPAGIDEGASRLHAAAWMAWWIAFVPGALLLALAGARRPGWRVFALASLAAAVLAGAFVLLPLLLPAAVSQRLAFLAWLAWLPFASRVGRVSGSGA